MATQSDQQTHDDKEARLEASRERMNPGYTVAADVKTRLDALWQRLQGFVTSSPKPPTMGIEHLAVLTPDPEGTADFYSNVLGMPVVEARQALMHPESTRVAVAVGGGSLLAFFTYPPMEQEQKHAPVQERAGYGGLMHVAFTIERDEFRKTEVRLKERGIECRMSDSVAFVTDPINGLVIEFMFVDHPSYLLTKSLPT